MRGFIELVTKHDQRCVILAVQDVVEVVSEPTGTRVIVRGGSCINAIDHFDNVREQLAKAVAPPPDAAKLERDSFDAGFRAGLREGGNDPRRPQPVGSRVYRLSLVAKAARTACVLGNTAFDDCVRGALRLNKMDTSDAAWVDALRVLADSSE